MGAETSASDLTEQTNPKPPSDVTEALLHQEVRSALARIALSCCSGGRQYRRRNFRQRRHECFSYPKWNVCSGAVRRARKVAAAPRSRSLC